MQALQFGPTGFEYTLTQQVLLKKKLFKSQAYRVLNATEMDTLMGSNVSNRWIHKAK